MKCDYFKYSGLCNDFIIIDGREWPAHSSVIDILSPQDAMRLCDRKTGIGADGLLIALRPFHDHSDLRMGIYNADGSIPEVCGNGLRCLAQCALKNGWVDSNRPLCIESGEKGQRRHTASIKPENCIMVDMGVPIIKGGDIPVSVDDLGLNEDDSIINQSITIAGDTYAFTAVSMGNPHVVIFDVCLSTVDVPRVGAEIETHSLFPNRTNVEFVEIVNPNYAVMRVWERGVGETHACGSGACAVVVAGVLNQRLNRKSTITLPGGDLDLEWNKITNSVWMTGAAVFDYSKSYDFPFL